MNTLESVYTLSQELLKPTYTVLTGGSINLVEMAQVLCVLGMVGLTANLVFGLIKHSISHAKEGKK